MRKMISSFFAITMLVLSIAGCATPIPPEVIANADYGPPPPKNYQDLIKQDFAETLIDPTSPLYTFGKPEKGYTRQSPTFGTQQMFGWQVCGTVNSKNRFGGYVGRIPFFVLFRDGVIVYRLIGEAKEGYSIVNAGINGACQDRVTITKETNNPSP